MSPFRFAALLTTTIVTGLSVAHADEMSEMQRVMASVVKPASTSTAAAVVDAPAAPTSVTVFTENPKPAKAEDTAKIIDPSKDKTPTWAKPETTKTAKKDAPKAAAPAPAVEPIVPAKAKAVETPVAAVVPAPAPVPTTPAAETAEKPACPGVEVLPETRSMTYFEDPTAVAGGDPIARAALTRVRGGCSYDGNKVTVDVDLIMRGHIEDKGRKEKDRDSFMTFPYFVAISDAKGNVMDKEIFATAMKFPPKHDDIDHIESNRQMFMVDNAEMGKDYTITIGFQLTREQLQYNARSTVQPSDLQAIPAGTKKMAPIMDDK